MMRLAVVVACGLFVVAGWFGMSRAAHVPVPETCQEGGPADCVVDESRVILFSGQGAEYWHNEARKLQRKVDRLKKRLRKKQRKDAKYAIKLASNALGVPEWQMRSVAWCESRLNPWAKNRSSTAAGLFQFLDSTWARSGMAVFSVYDPLANALAAAKTVRADGGWRQWSCKP